jgi:RNA polymerase sigma-70 factor (ECF subfamily)
MRAQRATSAGVFDAHASYVMRTLRCLGVPERELEDARQDVFEVVARRLGELGDPSAIRAWLYGICVRKALSRRRTAARRREDLVESDARASEPTQEGHVDRTRALAWALAVLEALDDDKRAVFVLYEVEQLTMAEVAAVVGCPLQTAYGRLYAARREVEARLRRDRARGKTP